MCNHFYAYRLAGGAFSQEAGDIPKEGSREEEIEDRGRCVPDLKNGEQEKHCNELQKLMVPQITRAMDVEKVIPRNW
jgi:hypothetical protein